MRAELLLPATEQRISMSSTQLLNLQEGAVVTIHSIGIPVIKSVSPIWMFYRVRTGTIVKLLQKQEEGQIEMLSGDYFEFTPNTCGGFTPSVKVRSFAYNPNDDTSERYDELNRFMRRFGK